MSRATRRRSVDTARAQIRNAEQARQALRAHAADLARLRALQDRQRKGQAR